MSAKRQVFLSLLSVILCASQEIVPDALEPLGKISHLNDTESSSSVMLSGADGFKRAADILLSAINESVDPCQDFHEFACGKWIANNPVPEDMTMTGRIMVLKERVNYQMKSLFEDSTANYSSSSINTVRQIYAACMDKDTINAKKGYALLGVVEKLGHWPIVHGVADDERNPTLPNRSVAAEGRWSDFNLTRLLIGVGQSRPTSILFNVFVEPDEKNVSRRLLHIDQGEMGLGPNSRNFFLNDSLYGRQMAAYEQWMFDKVRLLREDLLGQNAKVLSGREEDVTARLLGSDNVTLREEVRSVIDFERRLAEIMTPEAERRNASRLYNRRRLSDLATLISAIDWPAYLRGLMPKDMHEYLAADPDPEVIIYAPEFLQRLNALLANESEPRVVADYAHWRHSQSWAGQLDERYDDVHQTFLHAFAGRKRRPPRWKECITAAGGMMDHASGAMYVRRHFDARDRDAALHMVGELKDAFLGMLVDNEWMEEGTRKYAMKKALEMQRRIGFPDLVLNDTALDEFYANFSLAQGDGYSTAAGKVSRWAQAKAFRRLLEPVDRAEFGISPAVVNALYQPVKNGIVFPAAILQSPFFDRSFPKAVNYGGIGAVIGHEITHGFDDQGGQFDKVGNLENWWDPLTQRKFLNRTQCVIDQYSRFEVPGTGGLHINGVLTQGENIADNGGVKQAYKAYRAYRDRQLGGGEEPPLPGLEHYSNDQVFFIGYAQTWCGSSKPETAVRQVLVDPHSPMRFRVNGVVVNQPEFAKAFQCPAGSPMNPAERCAVW